MRATTRVFGARPLRRFIAHELETQIGRALLAGEAHDGAKILVAVRDSQLEVSFENTPSDDQAAAGLESP